MTKQASSMAARGVRALRSCRTSSTAVPRMNAKMQRDQQARLIHHL
mgnify:CR=1 FL=1